MSTSVRIAVVTGTTSGIGEAVATELLGRGWQVLGVGRRASPIDHAAYEHVQVDLGDTSQLVERLEPRIVQRLVPQTSTRVALVNNAAHIGLLGPIAAMDIERLPGVLAVNVVAPMWLMGAIVRHAPADATVRIVNVSTGAAVRGFAGLGAYGASKAALRMAGMVMAEELAAASAGRDMSILSFEPGTVDTPMQVAARSSSKAVLPSLDLFRRFHSEGRLTPPSGPASAIADYVESDGHAPFEERRHGG